MYKVNIRRHCKSHSPQFSVSPIINNQSISLRNPSQSRENSSICNETVNNDAYTCTHSCTSCTFKANSIEIINNHCNFDCQSGSTGISYHKNIAFMKINYVQ